MPLKADAFSTRRLIASPKFRAWAARFPLTRPIARRRTAELFDLCAGFVYAQILHACVQLRVFDRLVDAPQTAGELAGPLALTPEAAARLLDGAVALRLLEKRRGDRYGLASLGAAMVGNVAVESMVTHHALFYADLADPVALLRGESGQTQLQAYWAYARSQAPAAAAPSEVGEYTTLMAASQALVASEILDAYDLRRHACLMDVGGGDGSFLRAAAARAQDLQLMLFDLPAVAARAEARFAESGLAGRARTIGGSFTTDALPGGADVISLVRVVHDHDDGNVKHLLRQAFLALPAGGTLLLAEPMAQTPGAERMGDAYFGFYLLAMGSGRPRSAAVLTGLLREAGFARVRQAATSTPLLTSLLVATKA
jgi:demethylspheroidene O-methyltransferase